MFTINSDYSFRMGKTHHICEDYAIADNVPPEGVMVAVADGCSSSISTDIGARVLCHQLKMNLKDFKHNEPDYLPFFKKVLTDSHATVKSMGVPRMTLDDTLLFAFASGDQVSVLTYGDGVVAVKNKDGTLEVYNSIYDSGYPNYPNYLMDSSRKTQLDSLPKRRLERTRFKNGEFVGSENLPNRDGEYEYLNFKFEEQGIEFIALFSDGIHSFTKAEKTATSLTSSPVKFDKILQEALNFKSLKGKFVQRRMNKFQEYITANGWQHYDDFSVGAISFYEME